MKRHLHGLWLGLAVSALGGGASLVASPLVTFTATPISSPAGFYRYALQLIVPAEDPQFVVSGLIVLSAYTVFGLDGSSNILAPPQWGFIPPSPPFADDLTYFSTVASADVGPGTLGGFIFDSPTTPTYDSSQFQVVLIETTLGLQDPISPQYVPEPSSLWHVATALIGAGMFGRRRRAG